MNGTTETTRDPRETAQLDDMTKAQLLAFAAEVGIDLTGVKRTKADVLAAIIAAPRPAGGAATNEETGETTPAGEPLPAIVGETTSDAVVLDVAGADPGEDVPVLDDPAEQAALDATIEASVELVEALTDPAAVPAEVPVWAQGRLVEVLDAAGVPPRVHRLDVLAESLAVAYLDDHGTLVGQHIVIDAETREQIFEQLLAAKEA